MLKRLILITLLMILSAMVASFLAQQDGNARIEWLGYRIEIATSLLVVCLGVLLVIVVMFDRIITFFAGLPGRISNRVRTKRQQEGHKALALGLIAASVGDASEAAKQSRRANKLIGHNDTLTNLLDAQIAGLKGDTKAASRFFKRLSSAPATAWLGHAGIMRLKAEAGDDDAALEAGRAAFAARKNEPTIAKALFVLEAKQENWFHAITALTVVRRHAKDTSIRLEADTALAVLHFKLAEQQIDDDESHGALTTLERSLAYDPGLVPTAIAAAKIYADQNKTRKSIAMLEKAFAKTPHPEIAATLMNAYNNGQGSSGQAGALTRLVKLTEKGGNTARAIATCADSAIKMRLWGEAKRLVEIIPPSERSVILWSILAEVARNKPKGKVAKTIGNDNWPDVETCLNEALKAPRPPIWKCGHCGADADIWQAICGQCASFATLKWH